MERYFKIVIYTLFITILYYSNLWEWGILFCLLSSLLCWRYNINSIKLLLPIILALMSFVTSSYILFIIITLFIYVYRCILNDVSFDNSNTYKFFIVFAIALIFYNPIWSVYPILMTVLTFKIYHIRKPIKSCKYLIYTLVVSFIFISFLFISYNNKQEKRAYLHHGVWANSSFKYNADSLQSKVSYSYSELVDILNADTLSSISASTLKEYSELWIITPTKPFCKEELNLIKEWVAEGGNLILSSDHTDLYGHARCCNQIANMFNTKINYSASFSKSDKQFFHDSKGENYIFKTGTGFSGFAFPKWCAWLWEEDAYYMENNFFGPLSPSGDDSFSDIVLLGQTPYGLGQVSFIQDSTIFANFCLYQPHTLNLVKLLSSHSYICRLYFILFLLMIVILFAEYFGCKKILCIGAIYIPFILIDSPKCHLDLGTNPQYWTGNKEFVMENNCPYATISTAYSLSPLSCRKPIWIDKCDYSKNDVIWVDSIPPPNPNWRWIKVKDFHPSNKTLNDNFYELYKLLKVPYIDNNDDNESFDIINANARINDIVMNDWWYDSGILANRIFRINKWIAWLRKDSAFYNKQTFYSQFTDEVHNAILHIDKNEIVELNIPKPILEEGEVHFGNGVAGKIINKNGKISILGLKQHQENIYAPKYWAIDYIE